MTFYIYCAERSRWTKILTSAATDAPLCVYNRYFTRILIFRVRGYHCYGSGRTMTSTVAALDVISQRNAVSFDPYGMTDLN